MSLATLYGETQDTSLTLIRTFPLRPLRSEADLDEAMALLDALVVKDGLSACRARATVPTMPTAIQSLPVAQRATTDSTVMEALSGGEREGP